MINLSFPLFIITINIGIIPKYIFVMTYKYCQEIIIYDPLVAIAHYFDFWWENIQLNVYFI